MEPTTTEGISEPAFLLTELRYTLGQLHVQVLDLEPEQLAASAPGYRCVNDVLQEMAQKETEHQTKYAGLLHIPTSQSEGEDAAVPLPVNQSEEEPGPESDFEHRRAHTISILEKAGAQWSQELLEAVKAQVADDRRFTTEIAECRKTILDQTYRPDLTQPLTQSQS
jgi:hypothetical protein